MNAKYLYDSNQQAAMILESDTYYLDVRLPEQPTYG